MPTVWIVGSSHHDERVNIEPIVAALAPEAEAWIVAQRELHRPRAGDLPASVVDVVSSYFVEATILRARYLVVDALTNPPFYKELRRAAPMMPLIDFATMAGITFDDTVLISRRNDGAELSTLLFHELIHVVQYSMLGIPNFAHRYVRGWARGGMQYANIALERDAYELQGRFERGGQPFSVEEAVTRQLAARTDT